MLRRMALLAILAAAFAADTARVQETTPTDERAMVAQVYRRTYNVSLLHDFHDEFSDNSIIGKELEKTLKLYGHGGLTLAERIYYAVYGWGTDERSLNSALAEIRNMTPAQIALVDQQYRALSGGESLRDGVLGDLSGRPAFEAGMDLRGRPTTIAAQVQNMNDRYAYERGGFTNVVTDQYLRNSLGPVVYHNLPMTRSGVEYDIEVAQINGVYSQYIANGDLTDAQRAELFARIRIAEQRVQTYRESRDATAEAFANAAAIATAVSITVATAGTATPFTVTLLLTAGATAAAQASARFVIQGEAGYNLEVIAQDLLTGGITGATAMLAPLVIDECAVISDPNADAQYFQLRYVRPGEIIEWGQFYHNGQIRVLIRPSILSSDEKLLANIAHEMYELNHLRQIFAENGNRLEALRLRNLIDPTATDPFLHLQAWDCADEVIARYRSDPQ